MKAKWLTNLLKKESPLVRDEKKTETQIHIIYKGTDLKLNGVVSIKEMDTLCLELIDRFPWYNMPFKIKQNL